MVLQELNIGARWQRGTIAALCILLFGVVFPAEGEPASNGDALPPSPDQVLQQAFENRYELDMVSNLDLVIRDKLGQSRERRFRVVSKIIDDRVHSIGRLAAPEYVRGMTIMVIENLDRSHDSFVFLPSLGRTRRVSTAQRGDAFLGSDLTYEDFERQRASDFHAEFLPSGDVQGERVWWVRARPRRGHVYDHVDFAIAESDWSILEASYFKNGSEEAYRTIFAPRESMERSGGHVIPTRLRVENRTRGTTTEVVIHDFVVNPPLDDRLFSLATLDQERALPGIPEVAKTSD